MAHRKIVNLWFDDSIGLPIFQLDNNEIIFPLLEQDGANVRPVWVPSAEYHKIKEAQKNKAVKLAKLSTKKALNLWQKIKIKLT